MKAVKTGYFYKFTVLFCALFSHLAAADIITEINELTFPKNAPSHALTVTDLESLRSNYPGLTDQYFQQLVATSFRSLFFRVTSEIEITPENSKRVVDGFKSMHVLLDSISPHVPLHLPKSAVDTLYRLAQTATRQTVSEQQELRMYELILRLTLKRTEIFERRDSRRLPWNLLSALESSNSQQRILDYLSGTPLNPEFVPLLARIALEDSVTGQFATQIFDDQLHRAMEADPQETARLLYTPGVFEPIRDMVLWRSGVSAPDTDAEEVLKCQRQFRTHGLQWLPARFQNLYFNRELLNMIASTHTELPKELITQLERVLVDYPQQPQEIAYLDVDALKEFGYHASRALYLAKTKSQQENLIRLLQMTAQLKGVRYGEEYLAENVFSFHLHKWLPALESTGVFDPAAESKIPESAETILELTEEFVDLFFCDLSQPENKAVVYDFLRRHRDVLRYYAFHQMERPDVTAAALRILWSTAKPQERRDVCQLLPHKITSPVEATSTLVRIVLANKGSGPALFALLNTLMRLEDQNPEEIKKIMSHEDVRTGLLRIVNDVDYFNSVAVTYAPLRSFAVRYLAKEYLTPEEQRLFHDIVNGENLESLPNPRQLDSSSRTAAVLRAALPVAFQSPLSTEHLSALTVYLDELDVALPAELWKKPAYAYQQHYWLKVFKEHKLLESPENQTSPPTVKRLLKILYVMLRKDVHYQAVDPMVAAYAQAHEKGLQYYRVHSADAATQKTAIDILGLISRE